MNEAVGSLREVPRAGQAWTGWDSLFSLLPACWPASCPLHQKGWGPARTWDMES